MPVDEWTFPDEPQPDGRYGAIRFHAKRGEEVHRCAISIIAINDACKTEDTMEAAIKNYMTDPDPWNRLAISLVEAGRRHTDGSYFVTSVVAREFGLL